MHARLYSALLPAALLMLCPLASTQSPAPSPARPPIISAPQQPLPITLVSQLPACTTDQILLSTDAEDGNFDGMSHSGTLLILRNVGPAACRLIPLAQATLLDNAGKILGPFSTTPPNARGLHPGPAVLPLAFAANAELTATLRWVSGPVFPSSRCLSPATLLLHLGDLTLKTPLQATLCGDRANGPSAELSRFIPDPVVVEPR